MTEAQSGRGRRRGRESRGAANGGANGGSAVRFGRIALGGLLLLSLLLALFVATRFLGERQPAPDLSQAPTPSQDAEDHTDAGLVHLYVMPEDGRQPVIDEIAAAERTITLHIYLLSDGATINALEAAVGRGVAVRVLMEEHPFGGAGTQAAIFGRLATSGIDIRWGNPTFRFSHIKAMVIDGEAALIMNQNLTRSAFDGNRELNVMTTRPTEVAQVAALFEADWKRTAEPPAGSLIVSPTTSRGTMIGLIDGARRSLDLYAEVVRDRQMIDGLIAAAGRGVQVRLVMTGTADDDNAEERAELARAGVAVRLARGPYIHAKMILADGTQAFVGSQNLTATSLDLNRELGIVLDDRTSVRRAAETFAADFGAGTPEAES